MKRAGFLQDGLLQCGGLIVPPLLWAVNTQLGLALPAAECASGLPAIASFGGALLSLLSGWLSFHAGRAGHSADRDPSRAAPASLAFVGALSGLNSAMVAFALVLQGLSSLVLSGCER